MHGRKKVAVTDLEKEKARKAQVAKKIAAYNEDVARVMAARKAGQLDAEALRLCTAVLRENCEFYTLWNYRREIVGELVKHAENEEAVQKLYDEELSKAQEGIMQNPKSYWTWHHRLWAAEARPGCDWRREVKLCGKMLDLDSRNFHCWGYRRHAVKRAGIPPAEELEYTNEMINKNFSNYSAWHYRSKLLPVVHPSDDAFADALQDEFEKVLNAFYTEPDDQSAWLYHRWLLDRAPRPVRVAGVCAVQPEGEGDVQVMVCFNYPVKGADGALSVAVGDAVEATAWRPWPRNAAYATLWTASVACKLIPCKLNVKLSALEDVCASLAGPVLAEGASFDVNVEGSPARLEVTFATPPSPAPDTAAAQHARGLLEKELAGTEELLEIEPESKWALLTKVFVKRALGSPASHLRPHLDTLASLDAARAAYYHHMASSYAMEDFGKAFLAEGTWMKKDVVDLSARDLTTFVGASSLLGAAVRVSLARNRLRSCEGINMLFAVVDLDLDDNELVQVDDLNGLLHLRTLSLRRNRIATMSALAGLKGSKLTTLHLEGNPVTDAATPSALRALLPQLSTLDSSTVNP